MLQSPQCYCTWVEGGYGRAPFDNAQQHGIDLQKGYYMCARFYKSLTVGSFQGPLQHRGAGLSYIESNPA